MNLYPNFSKITTFEMLQNFDEATKMVENKGNQQHAIL